MDAWIEVAQLILSQQQDAADSRAATVDCIPHDAPPSVADRQGAIQAWWRDVSRLHEAVYCRWGV